MAAGGVTPSLIKNALHEKSVYMKFFSLQKIHLLPRNPVVDDVLHVEELPHAERDAAHAPQINLPHQIQVKLKFFF